MLGMASQCFLTSRISFDPPISAGLKLGIAARNISGIGRYCVFCAEGDKRLAAMESAVRGLSILKGNGSKLPA